MGLYTKKGKRHKVQGTYMSNKGPRKVKKDLSEMIEVASNQATGSALSPTRHTPSSHRQVDGSALT